jgi:F-type H+-transporting ATPase subunit gamma
VLKSLVARAEIYDPETGEPRHPLLARRPEKTTLMIVLTADRGLAGAFNANIVKAAARFLEANPDTQVDIEAVGRKGRDFLRRRFPTVSSEQSGRAGRVQIVGEHVGVLGKLDFAYVRRFAEDVIDRYTAGEVDAVYLVYNEFKSVIAQRLVADEILPIEEIGAQDIRMVEELTKEERERRAEAAKSAGVSLAEADTSAIDQRAAAFATAQVDYIYEQPPQELFRNLLPKYVTVQIWRAFLESVAAEQAARMTAMDSATSNADEMIDKLTLVMNRVRQAKITKEIIEIVSGAAAQ